MRGSIIFFREGVGVGGGSAEGYLSLPAIRGIFSAILLCKFEKFKFFKEERGGGPDHRPPPPPPPPLDPCMIVLMDMEYCAWRYIKLNDRIIYYSDIKCRMLTRCSGYWLSCSYNVVTCDIERCQTYIIYIICTCIYWNAISSSFFEQYFIIH